MASIQHLIQIQTPNGNTSVYRKLREVQRCFWNDRYTHAAIVFYKGSYLTAHLTKEDQRWIATTTENL